MGDLSKDINSSFESYRIKALLNIIYTANWVNSCQNEFFKSYGISPQQYNILRILKGAGEALKVQTIKDRTKFEPRKPEPPVTKKFLILRA